MPPGETLWLVAAGAAVALFFAAAIGFARRGPVRWVKIATALLLADFLALVGVGAGWAEAARFGGITAGSVFVAVSLAFVTWRQPVSKVFSPATFEDCPAHARRTIERWTGELEAMGFGVEAEARAVWRLHGGERAIYVRFLAHHGEPFWVELHALDEPKVTARMAVSDKGNGRAAMTCDKQADQELFVDPHLAIRRVPGGASCAELVDVQRKLAMTTDGRLERVEDPVRAHVEIHGAWAQRLLAWGEVRRAGDGWIALVPTRIPGLVLKTMAAWFH